MGPAFRVSTSRSSSRSSAARRATAPAPASASSSRARSPRPTVGRSTSSRSPARARRSSSSCLSDRDMPLCLAQGHVRKSLGAEALHAELAGEPERALAVLRAVPGVDVPVRQLPFQLVGLDDALGGLVVALLLVLDLDQAAPVDPFRQRCDQALLGPGRMRLGGLREVELAERLLELRPDAIE